MQGVHLLWHKPLSNLFPFHLLSPSSSPSILSPSSLSPSILSPSILSPLPPLPQVHRVVEWALLKLELMQYADKPAGTYSGGNRRKLSAAIALLAKPPLILLVGCVCVCSTTLPGCNVV